MTSGTIIFMPDAVLWMVPAGTVLLLLVLIGAFVTVHVLRMKEGPRWFSVLCQVALALGYALIVIGMVWVKIAKMCSS
jgi:hypothetical protein